jgi:PAS domain S-box-containing protein
MTSPSRGRAFGVALGLVAAAALARLALAPLWGEQVPFLTFSPAVALAAWFGGWPAGALATLLSALLASLPIPGAGPAPLAGAPYGVALGVFVFMNVIVSILGEQLHRARREADLQAEATRQSERRASRLFESNIIGVVYWNADGGISDANDAFLAIVRRDRDELRDGRVRWPDIVAPDCLVLHQTALEQIRARGECDPFDSTALRADGTRVPIFCGGVRLDEVGAHGVTFVLDMTESRRAREALQVNESRYRTLFEESPIGLLEEDWSGVKRGFDALAAGGHDVAARLRDHPDDVAAALAGIQVIRVNKVALGILGVASQDELAPDLGAYVPPETRGEAGRVLVETAMHGEPARLEQTLQAADGTRRDVLIQMTPMAGHETLLDRVLISLMDISDRKSVEAQREELLAFAERARHEAEAASRAKDEFLATISHELRTPLSPILAWSRMLREGGLEPERASHALEVIERSARTQAQLIEDLLDVSRIMAGKMRLDVRPVMLAPIVERALEVVRPSADAKGLRLHVVLDSEAGAVLGDDGRLQQVVWNLLANAVKFTPKGGRVQVSLARVDSHLEVAVADTGEGMDAEFLPHVFDRFRQADASMTRNQGGLGLGLAIVRHIVEAHGGRVRAESAGRGRGSTFVVELPLMVRRASDEHARRHPAALPLDDAPLPRLDGLRVLIVDDEPDSSEVVAELLASRGAEVRRARSAEEARTTVAAWRPTLLVSDIGMPGEDGYAFIARWRADPSDAARIPAVALTAYAGRNDRIRLLSAGFDAHVPKPLDPAELVTVLASLARSADRP